MTTTLNTPWQLAFDRDGTEDYAIIIDRTGTEIAASHLPGIREGQTCWLPEKPGDAIPLLVHQMTLMAAAPKLLEALDELLRQTVDMDLKYGIGLSEGEEDARRKALQAIAEASNPVGLPRLPEGEVSGVW